MSPRWLTAIPCLLAVSTAQAQTTPEVGLHLGVVAGQFGGAVRAGVDHEAANGAWLAADGGLAGRVPVPYSPIEPSSFPLAGLGTLGAGWRLAVGERSGLGPVAHLDYALLAGREHDCGVGDGCRHWWWVGSSGSGGLGLSVAPAVGLGWRQHRDGGGWHDLALSSQPTFIYDLSVMWAPRIAYAWHASSGWGFDVRACRYGLTVGFTRAF